MLSWEGEGIALLALGGKVLANRNIAAKDCVGLLGIEGVILQGTEEFGLVCQGLLKFSQLFRI